MRSPTGAAPLPKGLACSRCKARKTRCSGERPACAACLRSARFKHRPLDQVVCNYGEPSDESNSPTSLDHAQSRKVPRLSLDNRSSSELSLISSSSIASTVSTISSRPSFASSTSSFQSFTSLQSGYETDASSLHSPSVDSFKAAAAGAPSLSNPYTAFQNPLAPPAAPALAPSSHYSPLTTPELGSLMNTISNSLSLYSPPVMPPPPFGPTTLSARRRNAPKSIPIPNQTLFDPSIPQSAPPSLVSFKHDLPAGNAGDLLARHDLSAATVFPSSHGLLGSTLVGTASQDDFNLPTPGLSAYSISSELNLPTPHREAMDQAVRDPSRLYLPRTGLTPTGAFSPWPTWAPRSPGWGGF